MDYLIEKEISIMKGRPSIAFYIVILYEITSREYRDISYIKQTVSYGCQ